MDRLIYVEGDFTGQYGKFWGHLGEVTSEREMLLSMPEEFDLVCFTGGSDVSPQLYQHRNLNSHNSARRDQEEAEIFKLADEWCIPMTGICRGSQFLNVMCGGTMVQHLEQSHGGGRHQCYTADRHVFEVTSTHHQMSVLGEGGKLLAWADETLRPEEMAYDGGIEALHPALEAAGNLQSGFPYKHVVAAVTEAFAYPDHRIFAVQHHPEYQEVGEEAPQWTLRMIREICLEAEDEREGQVSAVTA